MLKLFRRKKVEEKEVVVKEIKEVSVSSTQETPIQETPSQDSSIQETAIQKASIQEQDTSVQEISDSLKTEITVAENTDRTSSSDNILDTKSSSWASRLKHGLSKTRDNFGKKLLGVFGGSKIDEALYEEIETILLSSDIGYLATTELLDKIRKNVSLKGLKDSTELKFCLKDSMNELLLPLEKTLIVDEHKPCVIMMVGVNGAGKTTSIGKLAKYFQKQGKTVMLAAGDTFRAAAKEQLIEWGKRNDVTVVSQQSGDSAAVCYDAIQSAIANKIDVVLADTAGRLPTQLNLMEEIKKVKRVIGKSLDGAPHEILLVLDSNIGQNALTQVKAFDDALGLTGLILTKLDGTAKGGVICAIAADRPIPLYFIGVGESIDDLRPFNVVDYTNALF